MYEERIESYVSKRTSQLQYNRTYDEGEGGRWEDDGGGRQEDELYWRCLACDPIWEDDYRVPAGIFRQFLHNKSPACSAYRHAIERLTID